MKETDLQTEIKASVIEQGGYSIKMSNRFLVGIPDLLIALPPFAPSMFEVKELGECVDSFDRQLGVTPLQGRNLAKISACYGSVDVSGVLVGLVYKGDRILVALPRRAERLCAPMLGGPIAFRKRLTGCRYDMAPLLASLNIAKLEISNVR